MKNPTNIYNYTDYRKFLFDYYESQKAKRAGYSYRKFAVDMGFSASNHLHLVIKGSRKLSVAATKTICQKMPWSKNEQEYFQNLVLHNQAENNSDQQKKYLENLKSLSGKYKKILSHDQEDYFSNWYLPILREIIDLKIFKSDLPWLFHILRTKIPKAKIKEGLQLLVRLGMIVKKNGKWKQADDHLNTQTVTTSQMIYNYHKEMLTLSAESLSLPHEERDLTAMTMGLDQESFEWVRKRIVEFREEIQRELNDREMETDRVAQLNIQLFQITK